MRAYEKLASIAALGAAIAFLFAAAPVRALAYPQGEAKERAAIVRTIVRHWYIKSIPGYPFPRISRIGIAGNFAIAMVRMEIEGAPYHGEFLLERFPFGWQTLEIATDNHARLHACFLAAHNISPQVVHLLSERIGIAYAPKGRYCPPPGTYADSGAPASVLAIRKASHGGLVQSVRAVGKWGLRTWYGAGGGEAIYERKGSRWLEIAGGGGSSCPREFVHFYHMPLQTAKILLRGLVSGCK